MPLLARASVRQTTYHPPPLLALCRSASCQRARGFSFHYVIPGRKVWNGFPRKRVSHCAGVGARVQLGVAKTVAVSGYLPSSPWGAHRALLLFSKRRRNASRNHEEKEQGVPSQKRRCAVLASRSHSTRGTGVAVPVRRACPANDAVPGLGGATRAATRSRRSATSATAGCGNASRCAENSLLL